MRSGWTIRRSTSSVARTAMKWARIVASGSATRSTLECEMSRSCHSATSSSPACAYERRRRARPVRFSLRIGFFLCGIAELPFWPAAKPSSASPTSVRCQWRMPSAICSIAVPSSASAHSTSAWRSRATTCVATVSARSPSAPSVAASISGSRLPYTPTAPASLPTAIVSCAVRSRAAARWSSARQRANTSPAVIGSAWMPCERPIIGVRACSRARAPSAAPSASSRPWTSSSARRVCSASAVSSTSDDVIPRCSQRAGSPASSSTCVRNAITSWRVCSSILRIRSGTSLPLARDSTRSAVPAGTRSAASIARHAASSIASHSSKRYSSSHSAASSGRLYRWIMASPLLSYRRAPSGTSAAALTSPRGTTRRA